MKVLAKNDFETFWLRNVLGMAALVFANLASLAWAAPASLAMADTAKVTSSLTPEGGGKFTVEAKGVLPVVPPFFTAVVEQSFRVGAESVTGEIKLGLRLVQGKPEGFSLGLTGDGEIVAVSGAGLRDWAVRQGTGAEAGKRFLDLRLNKVVETSKTLAPGTLEWVVTTRVSKPVVPGNTALLLIAPGDAVGFASRVTVRGDCSLDLRTSRVVGATAANPTEGGGVAAAWDFMASGEASIELALTARGAAVANVELKSANVSGVLNDAAGSVELRLRGQAVVTKEGARLRVLSGRAALTGVVAGDGWQIELVKENGSFAYELVFDRKGVVPVDLGFSAALREQGDWRRVEFFMPAGAVVPVSLSGLPAAVEFDAAASVVPAALAAKGGSAAVWQGFLPADGAAVLAWRSARTAETGTVSFTSAEQTEVRVGAGLMRQTSQLTFKILQGKLGAVRLRVDGPGDIVAVEGAGVTGWKVLPAADDAGAGSGAGGRVLVVSLSRPVEGEGGLVVRSQLALESFPVRAEPLRLTPEGGVRHAGFVRVANAGAVRLEVADVAGMVQLAPEQFPGGGVEAGSRQVFVYRFPAAAHAYRVVASQIEAEVGVSQVVTYELGESDRVIQAELELDVREAPLREWSMGVPSDYAVVSLEGAEVADYALESEAREGRRTLKVIFSGPLEGRRLLKLRMEKNQRAGAGEWVLPALAFPGAKTVRGHLGVVATPGYRITPAKTERLVEVPLSLFPRQTAGLQQAWRLRETDWAGTVKIEALGQSVQSDVFHLYTLREGVVYGSVLINYFVVGAPASEWRIAVPDTAGNIDVSGQGVRRDWRREGGELIVTLHQPVLGAATLLVTFEEPMSARGGVIKPGEVRPIGVQAERGYVQVVSPLQVKHQVQKAEGGLLRLEALELPPEFRPLTSSPSLAVYQYTTRPFALELGIEWYAPGETVDQVVDFAKLSSQVSRDGQVVTDARFFVKTRGRKALRLELAPGVKLWEARVDNEVVNARADGGQTLVPLPARLNPNEPVEVALRLGQAAGQSASEVTLIAPKLAAPMVIGEWTLRGDPGRMLVPEGGEAEPVRPVLTETGFEYLPTRQAALLILLGLVTVSLLAVRARSARWLVLGLPVGALAFIFASGMALEALAKRRVNLAEVRLASAVVPAEGTMSVTLANVPVWRAMISPIGAALAVAGGVILLLVWWQSRRGATLPALVTAAGLVALLGGVLAQHGGAAPFFGLMAAGVLFGLIVPGLWRCWQAWRAARAARLADAAQDEADEAQRATGTPLVSVLLAFVLTLGMGLGWGANEARADVATLATASAAAPFASGKAAQAIVQRWDIRDGRLYAEVELTVRGEPGMSFLLLKAPAVLTEFTSDGLRVAKAESDGGVAYYVMPERLGTLMAKAKFELAVPNLTNGVALPTGAAAVQRITVQLDQGGWEFSSPQAVQVDPNAEPGEGRSGATLVLGAEGEAVIQVKPRRRDLTAEATRFLVETASLYVPGPGVVSGFARVSVRPVQGRVANLELEVPEGFTVSDVARGPVGAWRFDPATRKLRVSLAPAQAEAFSFVVETQRGAAAPPYELSLRPLRVAGAAGDVGMLALAFGGDAQPEGVKTEGLSPVNAGDFDPSLLPRGRDKQPLAVLQNVYRQGGDGGVVNLRVAAVESEVRVVSKQVFSIGDDRLVLAADFAVTITRVGLFKLSFELPSGLEVEALSGPALSHWTEAVEDARRIVTLHLKGRTSGEQSFALSLAGPAPAAISAAAGWPVPRVTVREATRQTGELQLVPEKGLRLRALTRDNVSPLDSRSAGSARPGTLAFRVLQTDWALTVGIEALEPWVTVQALQEVTAREGQTLTRLALRYKVENATVKHLRVRLPGLGAEQTRTVRASGVAVSDCLPVAGEPGAWDIRFQRGIIGETDVTIEYQGPAERSSGRETVTTPEFPGARQAVQFVAVRAGGRLELEGATPPRGWQRMDWSAVPGVLQDRADRSVPALCYRVAEPEGPLAVTVRRHEVAEALKLRVTDASLRSAFSPTGDAITAVELKVEVVEKGPLQVRLPVGAKLFNTLVNGESVSVVREGDAYLFHVSPATTAEREARVRLVYSVPAAKAGEVALLGPGLSVPLENVTWRVTVPAGYEVADYGGGLRLRETGMGGSFGVEDYSSLLVSRKAAANKKATDSIAEANMLLQKGQQQKAGEILSRASKTRELDEATNEDARVQLRALKTQQAVVGLNTRRQKLYLDNNVSGLVRRNEQLEQAANLNPFMQGRQDFDPRQVDQLLMGNSVEENTALSGIAGRIVDQQLAVDLAPSALDVTLPEGGRVLTFTRSLQVDGAAPLTLKLVVERSAGRGLWFALCVVGAVAGLGAVAAKRRRTAG